MPKLQILQPYKLILVLCILAAAAGFLSLVAPSTRATAQAANRKVYLPLAASSYRSGAPLLLGTYSPAYLGTQDAIDTQLKSLDNWSGKGISIAGTFLNLHDPHPEYNVYYPMERLWANGYTSFVNLMTDRSAAQVAQGAEDGNIQRIAAAFANWMALAQEKNQQRFVFIAPLPEANITRGNTYGGDPASYIKAYKRIQDIFASEFTKAKIPFSAINWVFAPNGADEPGKPTFESYYPGQDRVDTVAFSSYNWGYCVNWEYDRWALGPDLYQRYVQRMNALAPGKPVFISQTASTSEYPNPNNYNYTQKSQWFIDVYGYLSGLDSVRAILYFNIDGECDWAFYKAGSLQYEGYRVAVSSPAYEYWAPAEVSAEFSSP
ncbi:MAG: hypothetical protein ACWGO1_04335 [Anaerolineales bacterium]